MGMTKNNDQRYSKSGSGKLQTAKTYVFADIASVAHHEEITWRGIEVLSGFTLESPHDKMAANGFCPFAGVDPNGE